MYMNQQDNVSNVNAFGIKRLLPVVYWLWMV
jgi:hypothetical protein